MCRTEPPPSSLGRQGAENRHSFQQLRALSMLMVAPCNSMTGRSPTFRPHNAISGLSFRTTNSSRISTLQTTLRTGFGGRASGDLNAMFGYRKCSNSSGSKVSADAPSANFQEERRNGSLSPDHSLPRLNCCCSTNLSPDSMTLSTTACFTTSSRCSPPLKQLRYGSPTIEKKQTVLAHSCFEFMTVSFHLN